MFHYNYSTLLNPFYITLRRTPRFDRLLRMSLIKTFGPLAFWQVVLEVVSLGYARSYYTIQLPTSLYFKCRLRLDARLWKTGFGRGCNSYTPGPRNRDRRSHVHIFPILLSLGPIDDLNLGSFDTSDLDITKVLVDERLVDVGCLSSIFGRLCLFQTVEVRPWCKAWSNGLGFTHTSPSGN